MTPARTLHILLFILSVQIISLDPSFSLPTINNGSLSEAIKKESIQLRTRIQETLYSSKQSKTYDSFVMVGDVMLGRNVEVLMRRESASYPYEGLALQTLAPNPAIVGNFESAMMTPHVMTEALQMRFSVDETFLPSLAAVGYTHVSQANNHSLDYGALGYMTARASLLRQGITPFGHGTDMNADSIAYVESEIGTVAIVGINATASIPRTQDIRSLLTKASEHSTMQFVYIHWGTEYDNTHNLAQELLATELVAAGADLIVGHHPHVVQDIDVIDGVIVFYSLGNYIFDQYFSTDVKQGLVLVLSLDETPKAMLVPVTSEQTLSQPTLMGPQLHSQFLAQLAQRSDSALSKQITQGIIPLMPKVATSTKVAMMIP
jgi:poly-gamma-glutamate synthesis protein (capsule biosynthesis protein)